MTTQEMITELASSLGNRTDLTNARYITWLNWTLLDICTTQRKRAFPPKWFHILEGKLLFTTSVITATAAGGAASTITLAAGSSSVNDAYADYVVELTDYTGTAPAGLEGQKRVIVGYVGATRVATVSEAWDVNPDANTEYTLYKRIWNFNTDLGADPHDHIWTIQRLETVNAGTALTPSDWKTLIGSDFTSTGTPGAFARRGDDLLFDITPDEGAWYRMWYYRYPTLLSATALTTECELPEQFHEIVVLGALARGFEKLMEPDRAAETQQRYINRLTNIQDEFMLEYDQQQHGLKVKR